MTDRLTIRRAFEQWAVSSPRGLRNINLRREGDGYFATRTTVAWVAWQAAWKQASEYSDDAK